MHSTMLICFENFDHVQQKSSKQNFIYHLKNNFSLFGRDLCQIRIYLYSKIAFRMSRINLSHNIKPGKLDGKFIYDDEKKLGRK